VGGLRRVFQGRTLTKKNPSWRRTQGGRGCNLGGGRWREGHGKLWSTLPGKVGNRVIGTVGEEGMYCPDHTTQGKGVIC